MSSKIKETDGQGLMPNIEVKVAKAKLKPPPLYRVVLLNDDYTPMDFVIEVLQKFFAMGGEKAAIIMWQVHMQGKGICGVYSHDVAETKASQVNQYSKRHEHPLLCQLEKT